MSILNTILQEMDKEQVTVQGFGTMTKEKAQQGAISRTKQALAKMEAGDFANAKYILYKTGVLQAMLNAVSE